MPSKRIPDLCPVHVVRSPSNSKKYLVICGWMSCPGCGEPDYLLDRIMQCELAGRTLSSPNSIVFEATDLAVLRADLRGKCDLDRAHTRYWVFYAIGDCRNCAFYNDQDRVTDRKGRPWSPQGLQAYRECCRYREKEAARRRRIRAELAANQVENKWDFHRWQREKREAEKQREAEMEKIRRFVHVKSNHDAG